MSESSDHSLKIGRSFTISKCPRESQSENVYKGDFNLALLNELAIVSKRATLERSKSIHHNAGFGEYYKRFDHEEIPVKDCSANTAGDRASLTNSDLDKLEMKVFKNVSQELQTEDSTISGLESNIKFFKTTVQEIFDNFYTSMQDFELYKRRFQEILSKTREESVAEMEDFIKDMIQHIMSSETVSCETHKSTDLSFSKAKDRLSIDNSEDSNTDTNTTGGRTRILEAYKNDNYLTDSTIDDSSNVERSMKKREIFNIYLSGAPCVQIRMNDRHLLSEINIKDTSIMDGSRGHVASAENLEKLAAKKIELQEYARNRQEANLPDKEIPVKVSYAKKNIHLNEDFVNEQEGSEANKSLMAKICSFLCKKFRKNSL